MAGIKHMSPLFQKTFFLSLFLFGVASILTSGLAALILHNHMTSEFRSKGSVIAMSIAEASQEVLLHRDAAVLQATIDHYLEINGVQYVYIRDSTGEIVAHTFVPRVPILFAGIPSQGPPAEQQDLDVPGVGKILEVTAPILEGVGGTVYVGMGKSIIKDAFWKTAIWMLFLMAAIFIVSIAILFFLVRGFSRPLNQLIEYAQSLARYDFSTQIEIHSKDEVGMLASTMQSMAGELSSLFYQLDKEVKASTRELRKHLSHQAAIFNNLADGLVVIDPQGIISQVNPVLCDFFGYRPEDCLDRKYTALFSGSLALLMERVRLVDGELLSAEVELSHGRIGKAVGSHIRMADSGRFLGGVILIRDITREKELDALKTGFVSTVSHELRTPMTSILGFSKIIRKRLKDDILPALNEETSALPCVVNQILSNVDIIVSESERLTAMVNDVLDVAKMESGKVQWNHEPVSLIDVAHQALEAIQRLCHNENLHFSLRVPDEVPLIMGDRERLVQVMINLFSNAVKFMNSGEVRCRIAIHANALVTCIEDEGVGIEENALSTIFEKFRQGGDTLTDKPRGTGLGLSICREIIEHHGGSIWAESQVGIGSMFCFSLPCDPLIQGKNQRLQRAENVLPCEDSEDVQAQAGQAMLVEEHRDKGTAAPLILIVDDDESLTGYLSQLFLGEGFRVKVAKDGRAAVDAAKKYLPNLITMDLLMPGMDGETAIHCLRRIPYTSHIPILVLSALSENGGGEEDAVLPKTVEQETLLEVVNALLRERDLSRSCVVVNESEHSRVEELTVVRPSSIRFCFPEEILESIRKGFSGTVFISNDLISKVDMAALSRQRHIQVVIMPKSCSKVPNRKDYPCSNE